MGCSGSKASVSVVMMPTQRAASEPHNVDEKTLEVVKHVSIDVVGSVLKQAANEVKVSPQSQAAG
eukprot:m.202776 g.202776  ORF g.202776 m.202776 type:complete len:65 (-) comp21899_c0_seq1:454-648(-)